MGGISDDPEKRRSPLCRRCACAYLDDLYRFECRRGADLLHRSRRHRSGDIAHGTSWHVLLGGGVIIRDKYGRHAETGTGTQDNELLKQSYHTQIHLGSALPLNRELIQGESEARDCSDAHRTPEW